MRSQRLRPLQASGKRRKGGAKKCRDVAITAQQGLRGRDDLRQVTMRRTEAQGRPSAAGLQMRCGFVCRELR